jgi:hypothetical protein
MLRAQAGKLALALHLSALKPPAPKPHHARIATALLQDMAQRFGGQVFPLANGDLVLLCGITAEGARGGAPALSPLSLPATLAELFSADAPNMAEFVTLWRLDSEGAAFRAYLASRPAETAAPAAAEDGAVNAAGLAALEALLAGAPVPGLLAQQTAIALRPGRGQPLSARLAPLFRELTISMSALQEQQSTAASISDPFLFRHFATRLDARMLELLQADLEQGGRVTRAALRQGLPLHLNLTLEGIVSPAFARLVQVAKRSGAKVGVEISLMDAMSDLALMDYAKSLLGMAGFPLVLDGLDHTALILTHPAGLRPDMVKLTWSPLLAASPPKLQAAIDAAIERLTPGRIVLVRAEAEDALVWGQSRGIAHYQGFFLDAVQAAGRIAVCHSARACTLRQCMNRAGTLHQEKRAACGNPALLDTAVIETHAHTQPASGHAEQRTP